MDNSKMMPTAIVTVIVTLLVGGGIGYVLGNSMDDNTNTSTSNSEQTTQPDRENISVNAPAADLRVALNNALREHVDVAGVALRNIYTESPDIDAAVAALDENSIEVAGLVGSVYGEEAEQNFLTLWRQHIDFFANYTIAARDGDTVGMDQALEDLAGYGEAASNFFADANPNLPKEAVKPLLVAHRDAVILVINDIGAGDFDSAYKNLNVATDQVSEIADALAAGIEKQYPEMF